MYQLGHYGAALLAYAPLGVAVALAGFEATAVVGALLCASLSTLPDCDHHLPVDHRGPTHSVPFAVLVGAALAAAAAVLVDASAPFAALGVVAFAFVVGAFSILSHLLADAITPMGVRPFWPLSEWHYSADLTPAKNPVANYLLFGLGLAAVGGGAFVVTAVG